MIEYEIRQRGSCATLEDVPKGAVILEVDGEEVIARCEACGKPITDGDDCKSDAEGLEFCLACYSDLLAAAQDEERYVTHEMALDAGDPGLEGQPM